jgi:flagellar biogenesis protein FliO
MMMPGAFGVWAQALAPAAATASAAASTPLSHLPLQRETGVGGASDSSSVFLQVGVAIFLAAVIGGLFKLRQHRQERAGGTPGLKSMQTLRLTQHASLHVVQWDKQELLLACTAQHAELLSQRSLTPVETGSRP